MIDLTTEHAISLNEAARQLPPGRNGSRPHLSTLLRWILKGTIGPDGETVRLDAVRLGSRWVTSREALQRFAERLTPQLGSDGPVSQRRTPSQRRRAAERAERELEREGGLAKKMPSHVRGETAAFGK